jgi:hypothetical protein
VDGRVGIRVDFGQGWSCCSRDRFDAVERRFADMHGHVEEFGTGVQITLPATLA